MGNASKLSSIQKRKRLEALYARGDYIRFGPDGILKPDAVDTEDTVKIWVGPPSPLQREMSIREATASRNRAVLNARRNDSDSLMVNAAVYVAGLEPQELIDFVLDLDDAERLSRARREVLLLKEWEDFNSLRDAMRQYEEAGSPEDDPEWAPLLERDRQFGEAVDQQYATLREGDGEGLKLMPRPEQEKRAVDKRVDQQGSALFMKTYEDQMLWYACRDDEDHSVLFFDSPSELRSMPEEVQEALSDLLASFINEAAEAKNSQAAGSGSPSSEPVKEPETSPAYSPDPSVGF